MITSSDSLVGQVIAGRYKIIELLGKGGMSSVYKAQHLLLNKSFALKLMHAKLVADQAAVIRFRQEAAAASKLSHPNIITVYDFDVTDERPFQAIDYLEGRSLLDEIQNCKGLPLDRALHIWVQVCAALYHAHSNGIIHRDLKPSNVMLIEHNGDKDFVKLVDFGIAKILPQEGNNIQQLTQTGEVFGSPFYMSPEQCVGKRLDLRADIYSMGCLMFESLMGDPPFVGNAVFETIQMHLEGMPRSVKEKIADSETARRLDFIICKAMAKEPSERYQTMEELSADLEELASGRRANLLARAAQGMSIMRLKVQQTMRRKSIRLATATGIAVTICLIIWGATSFAALMSSKIPPLMIKPWPLFATEFEPTTISPQILLVLRKIEAGIDLPLENAVGAKRKELLRQSALLWRDAAVARSRHGQYQQGAQDAYVLRNKIEQLPDGARSLDDPDAPDRAKSMAEYASIGDACYYADSGDENNARNALYYYGLAADQLSFEAEMRRRRFSMKMADVALRLRNPELAQEYLLSACMRKGREYPQNFFNRKSLIGQTIATGIEDRAIYFSKIGDTSLLLSHDITAAQGYAVAGDEWEKLNQPELEGQARYLTAAALLNQVKKNPRDTQSLDQAEVELRRAIEIYSKMNPPNHAALATTYKMLADVNQRQNKVIDWLTAEFKAHQLAVNLPRG